MSAARGEGEGTEAQPGRSDRSGPLGPLGRLNDRLDRLAGRYRLAGWLFLRLLGIVYLVAFASLWVQVDGLLGSRGILPAARYLATATRVLGPERYRLLPTLFWLGSGDGALHAACAAGVVLALLVVAGVVEVPALAALWLLYLSLVTVGRDFLAFQWDALLLETGALAVFLPRPSWQAWRTPLARARPPRPLALLLLWWLLFRLMFSSGAVKLASGDPTWRSLDALKHHYETQPLPTWIGWLAHQLPGGFQVLSAVIMLAIELAVPWLVLGTRRSRRLAFLPLVGLQLLIAATGNYGFFNLLTVALCLPLLDDDAWLRLGRLGRPGRWLARRLSPPVAEAAEGSARDRAGRPWGRWLAAPFAAALVLVSLVEVTGATGLPSPWPRPIYALRRAIAPLRSVNGYGLFAVMTTERPEIAVEGSDDGTTWRPYRFRWKPGPLDRRPRFCEPHMPRLDWQMWFAALGGNPVRAPWFVAFLTRLAEGSPPVLGLLAENPFPGRPPRYLRARLYDYRFTDLGTLRKTGRWWRREELGPYLQEVTSEQLRALEP